MKHAFIARGKKAGRYQNRALMHEGRVFVQYRRKYRTTTQSNHSKPVYENLLERRFKVEAPNRAWALNHPYLWT